MKRDPLTRSLTLLLLLLAGCTRWEGTPPDSPTAGAIVPLHGMTMEKNRLTITVTSRGCTHTGDFALQVERGNVTIVRVRPDHCRKAPFPRELHLPLPPGLSMPLHVQNPFLPPPRKRAAPERDEP